MASPYKHNDALTRFWDSDTSAANSYSNLNEVVDPPPVQDRNDDAMTHHDDTLESRRQSRKHSRPSPRKETHAGDASAHGRTRSYGQPRPRRRPETEEEGDYDIPDNYANLDEIAAPSPDENPDEHRLYLHQSLEEARRREREWQRAHETDSTARSFQEQPINEKKGEKKDSHQVSRLATELYTISYLILFSFFGTLARLGTQAISFYPGAPIVNSVIWANFGGSLVMGFLSEDRMLFRDEWGTPNYHQKIQESKKRARDEEGPSASAAELAAAKKAHAATKKTLPLYIGLATGFCGSFTSFGSFMRDTFLAMSNQLPTPLNHPEDFSPVLASTTSTVPRNGGFGFMAMFAVIITTVSLSISALHVGAHIAIMLEPYTPSLPFRFCRKYLDPFAVFLAWGCWAGAIILAIWPPDRNDPPPEIYRGRAVFELVFSPVGCLARFYLSLLLNGKLPSFPLGTFVANIFGTAILGMSWDLQHMPSAGVLGCQVLQGIEGGFCGCLTTVSTWVSELSTLQRRHAYRYGAASLLGGFCFLVVIMGTMQWTVGFSSLQCTH